MHRVVGEILGISQGDLGGISGGAHPLEPYFENFNRKKSRVLILKLKYVDKILLEVGVLRDYFAR